jgi:hypothetical protein
LSQSLGLADGRSFVDDTAMVPNRCDFIGQWSENLGHTDDLSRDTVIQFTGEGVMNIVSADENINGRWECTSPGRLTMIMENGLRYGPFQITIESRDLPRGVLTSWNQTEHFFRSDVDALPASNRPTNKMLARSPRRSVSNFRDLVGGGSFNISVLKSKSSMQTN